MHIFWEPQDAARELNLSADSVRALERTGQLQVAARTPRGLRLFDPVVVEKLAQTRARQREAAQQLVNVSGRRAKVGDE